MTQQKKDQRKQSISEFESNANTDEKQNKALEKAEKLAKLTIQKEESMLLDTSPINKLTDKFEVELNHPEAIFEEKPPV